MTEVNVKVLWQTAAAKYKPIPRVLKKESVNPSDSADRASLENLLDDLLPGFRKVLQDIKEEFPEFRYELTPRTGSWPDGVRIVTNILRQIDEDPERCLMFGVFRDDGDPDPANTWLCEIDFTNADERASGPLDQANQKTLFIDQWLIREIFLNGVMPPKPVAPPPVYPGQQPSI